MTLFGHPLVGDPLVAAQLALAAAAHLLAVARLAGRGVHWPVARSAAALGGLLALAVALASPLAVEDERFPAHVVQHLLLGMVAPLLLALAAPVTLLLRTLPRPYRERMARLLHWRPTRWLAHPLFGALLAVGGMYALYLTPLYAATLRHPFLHLLLHAHFLLAGYLFAWSLVGLDPIPHRVPFAMRAAVLVLSLGAHATLAKLLYADGPAIAGLPVVPGSLDDWHLGTQIMWYGGDIVDVGFTVAFFCQWYSAGGRQLARVRRGAGSTMARSSQTGSASR